MRKIYVVLKETTAHDGWGEIYGQGTDTEAFASQELAWKYVQEELRELAKNGYKVEETTLEGFLDCGVGAEKRSEEGEITSIEFRMQVCELRGEV